MKEALSASDVIHYFEEMNFFSRSSSSSAETSVFTRSYFLDNENAN